MLTEPSADFSARVLDLGPDAVDGMEVERLRRILAAKEPASYLISLPNEELLERLGVLVRPGLPAQPQAGLPRLTVAGLLLVGREEIIRQQLPGHEAIYLHMQSDTEYDRRVDSARSLLALLEQFMQALEPYNRIYTLKLGLFHFEIPDFPEEVCREALLNAFVHRDYARSGPVYVRHFADKLEVSSPGGFFGDVSPQNILGHEPVSRNRLLAEILQKTRMVERAGMGVKRMYHILLSYGKEPPSYEAGSDFVRLNLRSGRAASATGDRDDAGIDAEFARFVVNRHQEGRELTLADLLVFSFLKRNREIDLSEGERILQRSEGEAREALSSMVLRGLLEPFGQKRGRVYRLSKAVYNQLKRSVSYSLFRRAEAAFAETAILNYLEDLPGNDEKRFVTNEVVRTLLRVSPAQARYLLSRLVSKQRLVLRGRGRAARYYKSSQLSAF